MNDRRRTALLAREHFPTARLEPIPVCPCERVHVFLVTHGAGHTNVGAYSDDRKRDLAAGRLVAAGVAVGRHNVHLNP